MFYFIWHTFYFILFYFIFMLFWFSLLCFVLFHRQSLSPSPSPRSSQDLVSKCTCTWYVNWEVEWYDWVCNMSYSWKAWPLDEYNRELSGSWRWRLSRKTFMYYDNAFLMNKIMTTAGLWLYFMDWEDHPPPPLNLCYYPRNIVFDEVSCTLFTRQSRAASQVRR